MIIEKKTWKDSFDKILEGKKDFEVRLDDFEVREGDELLLREWDPEKKDYTGRELRKKVKLVAKTKEMKYWKQEDIEKFGFQVIGLED